LDALGRAHPEVDDLRERALGGRRLTDPPRRKGPAFLAGALSLALAVTSFVVLREAFREGSDKGASPETPSPATAGALDPAEICGVPAFDPTVALLGEPSDAYVFPTVGPREFPLELLDAPGEAADTISGPASDALRRYLAEPDARNAPMDGWRAIAQSSTEVIFAAPPSHGSSLDWWVSRFARSGDGEWRFEHTELVEQHPTPAQLGRGLRLEWTGDVDLDQGRWTSRLSLVNTRDVPWTTGEDGYALWGRVYVFEPASGDEVGHVAQTVGHWGQSLDLDPHTSERLPLSIGGALADLDPQHEYDMVACVPELGLASPVGTLLVKEPNISGSIRVLTYPDSGFAMQALGGGRLMNHNGCLAVADRSPSPIYVLWPDGYSMVDRPPQAPVLIDAVGHEVAQLGDNVTLGGGYVPLDNAGEATIGGIPDACRAQGEGYFLTGGLAGG